MVEDHIERADRRVGEMQSHRAESAQLVASHPADRREGQPGVERNAYRHIRGRRQRPCAQRDRPGVGNGTVPAKSRAGEAGVRIVHDAGVRLAISQDADRHRVARNAEREVVRAVERIDDPDELPRTRIEGQSFLGHQAVVGKTRADPFHELRLDRDVDVRDPVAGPLPVDTASLGVRRWRAGRPGGQGRGQGRAEHPSS